MSVAPSTGFWWIVSVCSRGCVCLLDFGGEVILCLIKFRCCFPLYFFYCGQVGFWFVMCIWCLLFHSELFFFMSSVFLNTFFCIFKEKLFKPIESIYASIYNTFIFLSDKLKTLPLNSHSWLRRFPHLLLQQHHHSQCFFISHHQIGHQVAKPLRNLNVVIRETCDGARSSPCAAQHGTYFTRCILSELAHISANNLVVENGCVLQESTYWTPQSSLLCSIKQPVATPPAASIGIIAADLVRATEYRELSSCAFSASKLADRAVATSS